MLLYTKKCVLPGAVDSPCRIFRRASRCASSARRARDVANLGLAGMLRDPGKVGLSSHAQGIHEVLGRDEDREGIDYDRHPMVGYKMLVDAGVPTTARHAVLRRIPHFAVGSQVRLSDGQSAVVIAANLRQPCRPTVPLLDRSPQPSKLAHTTLNLVDHRPLHITAYAGVDVEKWLFELPAETAWRPASC